MTAYGRSAGSAAVSALLLLVVCSSASAQATRRRAHPRTTPPVPAPAWSGRFAPPPAAWGRGEGEAWTPDDAMDARRDAIERWHEQRRAWLEARRDGLDVDGPDAAFPGSSPTARAWPATAQAQVGPGGYASSPAGHAYPGRAAVDPRARPFGGRPGDVTAAFDWDGDAGYYGGGPYGGVVAGGAAYGDATYGPAGSSSPGYRAPGYGASGYAVPSYAVPGYAMPDYGRSRGRSGGYGWSGFGYRYSRSGSDGGRSGFGYGGFGRGRFGRDFGRGHRGSAFCLRPGGLGWGGGSRHFGSHGRWGSGCSVGFPFGVGFPSLPFPSGTGFLFPYAYPYPNPAPYPVPHRFAYGQAHPGAPFPADPYGAFLPYGYASAFPMASYGGWIPVSGYAYDVYDGPGGFDDYGAGAGWGSDCVVLVGSGDDGVAFRVPTRLSAWHAATPDALLATIDARLAAGSPVVLRGEDVEVRLAAGSRSERLVARPCGR